MTDRRGLFITFEGLDGSGKTTQMRRFAERLRAAGRTVVETVEPGGTAVGSAIRAILLDPRHHGMASEAEMLLYFAARAQNVQEILEPALKRGDVVISDRWTDSTLAYQGYGRGLGAGVVEELDRYACRGRRPDVTFWIDAPLEASLERARARNAAVEETQTRMDEQEQAFYERVECGYRALAEGEPERVVRVDGAGTPEEVEARVWQAWRKWEARHV
jgi:dTMP kinase